MPHYFGLTTSPLASRTNRTHIRLAHLIACSRKMSNTVSLRARLFDACVGTSAVVCISRKLYFDYCVCAPVFRNILSRCFGCHLIIVNGKTARVYVVTSTTTTTTGFVMAHVKSMSINSAPSNMLRNRSGMCVYQKYY